MRSGHESLGPHQALVEPGELARRAPGGKRRRGLRAEGGATGRGRHRDLRLHGPAGLRPVSRGLPRPLEAGLVSGLERALRQALAWLALVVRRRRDVVRAVRVEDAREPLGLRAARAELVLAPAVHLDPALVPGPD